MSDHKHDLACFAVGCPEIRAARSNLRSELAAGFADNPAITPELMAQIRTYAYLTAAAELCWMSDKLQGACAETRSRRSRAKSVITIRHLDGMAEGLDNAADVVGARATQIEAEASGDASGFLARYGVAAHRLARDPA